MKSDNIKSRIAASMLAAVLAATMVPAASLAFAAEGGGVDASLEAQVAAIAELESAVGAPAESAEGDFDIMALLAADEFDTLATPFPDVSDDDWHAPYAQYVSDKGYITGLADGTFAPYQNVNRGMVATVLWRMAGKPYAPSAGFKDVQAGAWYADAVNWAKSVGLAKGYAGNVFKPGANITRQEVAVMLHNYARLCDVDMYASETNLKGIGEWWTVADWAKPAMTWVTHHGIIGGVNTSQGAVLQPSGTTWRSALAKMVTVLDQDVLGGVKPAPGATLIEPEPEPEPEDPGVTAPAGFTAADQYAVNLINQALVEADADAYAALTDIEGENCIFVAHWMDLTMSNLRYAYRNSSSIRSSLADLMTSTNNVCASSKRMAESVGSSLPVYYVISTSDNKPIMVSRNGRTYISYRETLG